MKATLSPPLLQTLTALEDLVQSFGNEVQCKELRLYTTFKTLPNFATVVLQRSRLLVYLHLDAAIYVPQIQPHIPATRDVSAIVHWGTGDIEVPITQLAELQALEPYPLMALRPRFAASPMSGYVWFSWSWVLQSPKHRYLSVFVVACRFSFGRPPFLPLRRLAAFPFLVFGPVDKPPCSLQRPFL